MGSNVFVSYKYADRNVARLGDNYDTTCRDYVDQIEEILKNRKSYYFRGERDGEDLSNLDETTIMQKLADKMFYTSVTVVLISAGMREYSKKEIDQWIPWEVSYSLSIEKRSSGRSGTNAVLGVVIPNWLGRYDFAITDTESGKIIHTDNLFKIIGKNMFNIKNIEQYQNGGFYRGPVSYISLVKWSEFESNPNYYLYDAEERRNNANNYDLVKRIDPSW